MASRIPSTPFRQAADPQLSSPFFSLLPAEIRNLIYLEFWELCNARQHIVFNDVPADPVCEEPAKKWSHVPCITDPRAADIRLERLPARDELNAENKIWVGRLKSEWCLHWACQEQDASQLPKTAQVIAVDHGRGEGGNGTGSSLKVEGGSSRGSPTVTGFLAILQTCQRMYHEGLPSLYSNLTFVLTDTRTAEHFLSRYGADSGRYPIRSLELCIRAANILTEIYYPPVVGSGSGGASDDGPPAVFAGTARPGLSMNNNPWQRVCDALAALPGLHALRIWFDSSDLRPWHKRVSETRFFGRLFTVRVLDRARFVLALPELPDRRGPDSQLLAGHYLEGDKLEGAPFTVERGPRPNNWRVHLRNIATFGGYAS